MSNWYEISYPKEISNKDNDFVAFTAKHKDKVVETTTLAACYANYMGDLPGYEFTCIPCQLNKSYLPYDIFCRWVELCKLNGLMTDSAIPFNDKGKNCCTINGKGHNRHMMYASLCCYRWAENQAQMPYLVVKLLEVKPDLNFFQALAYSMSQHIVYANHSFCSVQKKGAYTIYGSKTPYSLVAALVVSYFFRKNNGESKAQKETNATYTNSLLNLQVCNLFTEQWHLPTAENYLHEAWKELYELENPTKESVLACYTRVKERATTTPI